MEVKELNQDHTVGKRVWMIILPIGGMNACINKGMNGKITNSWSSYKWYITVSTSSYGVYRLTFHFPPKPSIGLSAFGGNPLKR